MSWGLTEERTRLWNTPQHHSPESQSLRSSSSWTRSGLLGDSVELFWKPGQIRRESYAHVCMYTTWKWKQVSWTRLQERTIRNSHDQAGEDHTSKGKPTSDLDIKVIFSDPGISWSTTYTRHTWMGSPDPGCRLIWDRKKMAGSAWPVFAGVAPWVPRVPNFFWSGCPEYQLIRKSNAYIHTIWSKVFIQIEIRINSHICKYSL